MSTDRPKPKFRVGQVVMVHFYKSPWEPAIFKGEDQDGRLHTSRAAFLPGSVRPLTKCERGLEPEGKVVKRGK
ncbi:MAG: hypothetical protein KGL39_15955 [Patescibacteria group bacterium]|nr:hypothetical protein [Patescibacteria group bacterium]